MGDMLSLIEKAQEDLDEEEATRLEEKIKKNKFTLEDFLDQMGQIRKMGGIAKMLDMLPGVSGNKNVNLDQSEKDFVCFEAIIQSMTKEERENPSILNASRRKRIAAGSGQSVQKINQLTKRYEESRKMMKQMMSPKGAAKISRIFGGFKGLQ
jgi:signal recognition particle subunit SRP54